MELDELKSTWKQTGTTNQSLVDLKKMTEARNHPALQRIRIKLFLEGCMLIIFLSIFTTAFDASTRPLWQNICLVSSAVLYLVNDMTGYFILQRPVKGHNLLLSMNRLIRQLRRLSVSSIILSFFFGGSVIVFFTTSIDFTTVKYMILAGMLITWAFLIYVSFRNWSMRIQHIQKAAESFTK